MRTKPAVLCAERYISPAVPALLFLTLLCAAGCARAQLPVAPTATPFDEAVRACVQPDGSKVLGELGIVLVAELGQRYQRLRSRKAWQDDDFNYYDVLFAAQWLSNSFPSASYTLSAVDSGRMGRRTAVCASIRGAFYSVLDLGSGRSNLEYLEPAGLRTAIAGMRVHRNDEVIVASDSSVRAPDIAAVVDSLHKIERLLGMTAIRPALLLLYANQSSLKRAYPAAWAGGKHAEVSVAPNGAPGMAFMAQRERGFNTHELVHLVVAGWKGDAGITAFFIPYFAEEALARAIGGALGRSLAELSLDWRNGSVHGRIGAVIDSATPLAGLELVPGTRPPYEIDVLAALYRVAVLRCASFPVSILRTPDNTTLLTVTKAIAQASGISVDEVLSRAAAAIAEPTSPIQKPLGERGQCADHGR